MKLTKDSLPLPMVIGWTEKLEQVFTMQLASCKRTEDTLAREQTMLGILGDAEALKPLSELAHTLLNETFGVAEVLHWSMFREDMTWAAKDALPGIYLGFTFEVQQIKDVETILSYVELFYERGAGGGARDLPPVDTPKVDWRSDDDASGRTFVAHLKGFTKQYDVRFSLTAKVAADGEECYRVVENVEVSHYENKTYRWICKE